MRRVFLSLKFEALAWALAVFLPIIITFGIGYAGLTSYVKNSMLDNLTAFAELFEGVVYQFLDMGRRRVVDFSSDGYIREKLKEISAGDESKTALLNNHLIRNKKSLDKTIHAIYVMSLDGRVRASTDPSAVGMDFKNSVTFEKGVHAASFAEVYDPTGLPKLAVSAPVTDKDTGKVIGVIANFILFSELNKLLSGEFGKELGAPTWGRGRPKSFEAYIVDRGRVMTAGSGFGERDVLRHIVDTPPVRKCIESNAEMAGFYRNYRGIEVAGASMCLSDFKWTLAVEVEKSEAMAPALKVLRGAALAGAVVSVLVILLFIVFSKKVVGPLKNISFAADAIAKGDYGMKIPVKTRNEIGELAQSFNLMAGEVKKKTEALMKAKARLLEAQTIGRIGSFEWDLAANEIRFSPELYRVLGVNKKAESESFESLILRVHPADREFVKKCVYAMLYNNDTPLSVDCRVVNPEGPKGVVERAVHLEGSVTRDTAGQPSTMLGTMQDITERKTSELKLKKLTAAMENSGNIVFITDINGVIEYANPAIENISQYSREEVIGQRPNIFSSGETTEAEYASLWNTVLSGRTWRGIFKNKKKNGEFYWVNSVITPVMDEKGAVASFLSVQEDITETMRSEERVRYISEHDDLTGFYNRAYAMNLIDMWIARGKRDKEKNACLIIMNIDHFKEFNDSYGHLMGDEYLRNVARTIDISVRGMDTPYMKRAAPEVVISRLGGDEFAVFIPYVDEKEAWEVCEVLGKIVEEMRISQDLPGLTVSAGVSLFPGQASTTRELFSMTDAALHRAKEYGGNRCHVYSSGDHVLEDMHSRLKAIGKIKAALEDKRFEPWFQPILDLKTDTVSRYEALVRMVDTDGAIVLPGAFIDVAERFGLIGKIDRVVIEKTMMTLADTVRRTGVPACFSMNLSVKDIDDDEFLEFLQAKISKTGVDPASLVFEITETAALKDFKKAAAFIGLLKGLGCRFSLDDFGVGFTSFTYLKQLSVDYIKIDGSFIRKLNETLEDRLFVKAIVDVAKGMNIKTVAEFVENRETLDTLKELGVDYAQGFYIGKPRKFPVYYHNHAAAG